jgi:hypothetical protein
MRLKILTVKVTPESWEAQIVTEGSDNHLRCYGASPDESVYRLALEYLQRRQTCPYYHIQVRLTPVYYSENFCYYAFQP